MSIVDVADVCPGHAVRVEFQVEEYSVSSGGVFGSAAGLVEGMRRALLWMLVWASMKVGRMALR